MRKKRRNYCNLSTFTLSAFSFQTYFCIVTVCLKAAENLSYQVAAVADPHTVEGIVESIQKLNRHVQTA